MPDRAAETRFRNLLGCLLENSIEVSEIRELTELVKAYPEFCEELKNQLRIDEHLAQYENSNRSQERFTQALEAALDTETDGSAFMQRVIEFAKVDVEESRNRRAPWIIAISAIAACIAFMATWSGSPSSDTGFSDLELAEEGVAVVSKLVGELRHDDDRKARGDMVSKGILELETGYATLEFFSGAQVSIAGPAILELSDSDRVVCRYGKLRAKVPYVAQGFTIETPESDIIDLGTEFGVDVNQVGKTEIHVFDGEVEAYDAVGTPSSKVTLEAGLGLSIGNSGEWKGISAEQGRFVDLSSIHNLEQRVAAKEFAAWKKVNTAAKSDERLIGYWDFEPDAKDKRALRNQAPTANNLDGAIVGASWSEGPWPGKSALSFKRPGDQVRVHVPGDYKAVSLAAWVLIDGLDRKFSSLFLSDGWERGEFHWQFQNDGALNLGVNNDLKREIGPFEDAQDHLSKPIVNLSRLGRWMHVATVVDTDNKLVMHYLNGRVVNSSPIARDVEYKAGLSTIGNWNYPLDTTPDLIRSLNGKIAELMLFNVALSHEEVHRLALKNKADTPFKLGIVSN